MFCCAGCADLLFRSLTAGLCAMVSSFRWSSLFSRSLTVGLCAMVSSDDFHISRNRFFRSLTVGYYTRFPQVRCECAAHPSGGGLSIPTSRRHLTGLLSHRCRRKEEAC